MGYQPLNVQNWDEGWEWGEESKQNVFKKASECFYMYQKHTELWVRPVVFEKETFLGLLA